MHKIATIEITSQDDIDALGRKIHLFSSELNCSSILCGRITASVLSQAGTCLKKASEPPKLTILLKNDYASCLLIIFWSPSCEPTFKVWHDDGIKQFEGESLRQLSCPVPYPSHLLDFNKLNALRKLITQPTRKQLLLQVQKQNQMLEQHGRELENRVQERTVELEQAKLNAEAATKAKSQFLSSMSHELRTPLNGVLGYAQVLAADPSLNKDHQQILASIDSCGRHLLNLINEILDLSKIEAGRMKLQKEEINIPSLIHDVCDITRSKADEKNLTIIEEISEGCPEIILSDETKLRQILVNLVGNSVKFTSRGEIRLLAKAQNGQNILFSVSDTGLGIAQNKQSEIFEAFIQEKAGQQQGGTGLGLSISKHLIEELGGKIEVASEEGKGSCFSIVLPIGDLKNSLQRTQKNLIKRHLNSQLNPTILILEKDDAKVEVLCHFLNEAGFRIQLTNNSKKNFTKTNESDLLLICDMYPQDELKHLCRQFKIENKNLPIIIICSNVNEELKTSGLCDDYLLDPYTTEELLNKIDNLLHLEWTKKTVMATDTKIATPKNLPKGFAEHMLSALETGDISEMVETAEQITYTYPVFAQTLKNMIKEYDFDNLKNCLSPAIKKI